MSAPTARMLEAASAVGAWRARTNPEFPDHDELLKVAAACHHIGAQLAFAYEGLQRQTLRRLCDYTNPQILHHVIPLLPRPRIRSVVPLLSQPRIRSVIRLLPRPRFPSQDLLQIILGWALPLIVDGETRKLFRRGLGKAARSCRRTVQRYHPYAVPNRLVPPGTREQAEALLKQALQITSAELRPEILEQAEALMEQVQGITTARIRPETLKQANALVEQIWEITAAGLRPVDNSSDLVADLLAFGLKPSSSTTTPSTTSFSTASSSTASSSTALSSTASSSTASSSTTSSSTTQSTTTSSSTIPSITRRSEPLSDRPEEASGQLVETITDGDAAAREEPEAVAEALPEEPRPRKRVNRFIAWNHRYHQQQDRRMNLPREIIDLDPDEPEQPRRTSEQKDALEVISQVDDHSLRKCHPAAAVFWAVFGSVVVIAMALYWKPSLGDASSANNEPMSGDPQMPRELWCFGSGEEDAFRLPGRIPLTSAFDPMAFATISEKLLQLLPSYPLPAGASSHNLSSKLAELSSSVNGSVESTNHQFLERLACSSRKYQLRNDKNATTKLAIEKDIAYINKQLGGLFEIVADLQSLYSIVASACYKWNLLSSQDLEELQSKLTWYKLVDNIPPLIWQYIPDTVAGRYRERLMKTLGDLEEVQSATAALEHASYELNKIRRGARGIADKIDDMAARLSGDG
ncbi:MAG: hypothetical protein Q9173_006586, partial [Seirophora scorigena]